jgi:hypothetical protein
VQFYIIGYNAKNAGKSMQVDNVILTGDIPEPGSIALLAFVAPLALLVRGMRAAGRPAKPAA